MTKEKERSIIMKSNEDFIKLCEDSFKKFLFKTQKEQLKKYLKIKNKYLIGLAAILLITVAFIYYIYKEGLPNFYTITIIILSFVFITGFIIMTMKSLKKSKKNYCFLLNVLIFDEIANYLTNNSYLYHNDTEISKEDFNKTNLFNLNYLRYTGDNLTAANYKNKKFVMCDVTLYDLVERIKRDSYYSKSNNTLYITNYHYKDKIDIFKGLYYETTINRENDTYIYMIPNNINDKFVRKNIYHYISYDGVKVELENLDFSERYSVFSINEIKSRYVLSLTLMEKINELDKLIKYKKYFIFKSDGRVGIFIDGFQIEDLLLRYFDLNKDITNEYLNKFFVDVKKLFDISQLLEDINTYH